MDGYQKDLREYYGRAELLISLKTSELHKADHALVALKSSLLDKFAELRQQGSPQIVITPPPNASKRPKNPAAEPEVPTSSLDDLIAYWTSQGEKRPRTIMEVETAKRRLLEIAGNVRASQIEKRHVVVLKDKLLADGLAVATINKQINLPKAVFEIAVANDMRAGFQSVLCCTIPAASLKVLFGQTQGKGLWQS